MLDLLFEGPLTTGELAERFTELSRFGVMQHLEVMAEADLVVAVREGRQRYNYLNAVPIQQVYDRWVSRYMQPWTDAHTAPEKNEAGWTEILRLLKSELETGDIPGKTKFMYWMQGLFMFALPKTTKATYVDEQGW